MAIHFIPLAIGAVAGSLITYLYTDKKSQEKLKTTAQNVSDKIKSYVPKNKSTSENSKKE